MERGLVAVQVLHEGADSTSVLEDVLLARTLVEQLDPHARVEEGQLAEPLGENVVVERDVGERIRARAEVDDRPAPGRLADDLQLGFGIAVSIHLPVGASLAVDGQLQALREGVDDRDPHTVKPAGDLVRVVVELAARVQHRHDDFGGRPSFLFVVVDRDPATVVRDRDRLVRVDRHRDFGAVPCERFVDGIVDGLEHHMMEPGAVVGVTDIHAGPFSHGLQALQDLDVRGIVGLGIHRKHPKYGKRGLYHLVNASSFHVEQPLRLHVARSHPHIGNRSQEQLRAGGLQLRQASVSTVRIQLRRDVVDQYHRGIPEHRGQIQNLRDRAPR